MMHISSLFSIAATVHFAHRNRHVERPEKGERHERNHGRT
jgi:hypothetical protein